MTQSSFALPDLTGKTAIVTGASSGIGLSLTRRLAACGASVVLAVRDTARAESLDIAGDTTVAHVDLADLDSVRTFTDSWTGPIDLLVNNAGVWSDRLRRTKDGFELQFGTNHLGHFALTAQLAAHLCGRVVTVSSQAERQAKLDFDDLNWHHTPYTASRAYNNSKLANLLFSTGLQRYFNRIGSPALSMAAHPGLVKTAIYSDYNSAVGKLVVRLLGQDADAGSLPLLYAAVADLPGDSFTGPERLAHMRGGAQAIKRSRAARDPDLADRLWHVSESMTGAAFPDPARPRPNLN